MQAWVQGAIAKLPRYIRAAQRNVDASIQKPQPSIPGKAKDFISGVKPMPGGQVGAGVKGSEEGPSKWSRIGSGNVDQGYTYEELYLGGANVKYVEYCPLESENFVPCFNVSENLDLGLSKGDEVYRFGAHLFSSQLLTMCVANHEALGSQVQLTLERGLPSMIGSFNSKHLACPSLLFDVILYAECHVDWDQKGVGPSLCSKGLDIESPYYRPLQACIAGMQSRRWIPIEERTKWPSRAKLNSNELKVQGDGYEAFLTYPRSYDLLHANGLLSLEFGQHSRCTMCDLFIEMDRVLRLEDALDLPFSPSKD
ncbi:putative pectin methyltransferase QUA2 [Capsicum chinense]|nr:putative pectin methyltransferase QUA2 [Capsicum chinense]